MTRDRRRLRASLGVALALMAASCDRSSISDPPFAPSLDVQVRQAIGSWGVFPIGAVPAQNPALVELGRSLFFDKILSGNRDVSCATCHDPLFQATDGLSLSVGTGGTGLGPGRVLGPGRRFVPRHAPSLLNQGIGTFSVLWDGRVRDDGGLGRIVGPPGIVFPSGLPHLLAAQAMLPVLSRVEMRGERGDLDRFGNPNELAALGDSSVAAIWDATMRRVLAIQEYAARFAAAFPGTSATSLGFQHAAQAIAAFEIQALTRTNSPFDRFLGRDDRAMTDEQKRGALLFFGRGTCASCHFGSLLGGQGFANIGVPQIGPGVGSGAPLDRGRFEQTPQSVYRFAFRAPPLRNVELTAPYMHNGAYPTLEVVVRHYTNPDSAQRSYDVNQLSPALRVLHHGDPATVTAVLATLDFRLRPGIPLTETERRELVAFLKSLTDPAARNLSAIVPASVPSGLPVRE